METKRKSFLARAAMTLLVTLLLTMTAQTAWAEELTETSGTSGACTWTFNTTTGQLTISGTGAMADYSWNWDGNPSPFFWCTNIKSVVVSEGVTRIGDKTFHNCTGIETVSLPKTLATIGESAFLSCTAITAFTVATENSSFASDDGLLYNADKTTLLNFPPAKTGTVTIPSTVTTLSNSAFNGATGITSLDLSACTSLTTISASLCYGCTNLQTVTLPASITVIGEMAFENCSSLQSINLNACTELTKIRVQAFRGCGSLEGSYTLPATLTCLSTSAFENCAALTKLTLTSTAAFADDPDDNYDSNGFGSSAFDGCTNLTLELPEATTLAIMAADSHKWKKYLDIIPMPSSFTGITFVRDVDVIKAQLDGLSTTTVAIPTDVKVNNLILPRTFNEDQVSTWMMPFPSYVENDVDGSYSLRFYTFAGVTYNDITNKWEATMNQLSSGNVAAANTPYIVKAGSSYEIKNENGYTQDFTLNTTTNSKQTVVGDWTFKGTYEAKTWTAGDVGNDYGFAANAGTAAGGTAPIAAGDFVKLAAGATCLPMRCYLTYTGGGNPFAAPANRAGAELPQTISVVLKNADGSTTEIGTITSSFTEGEQVWYSLDGMRLNEKPATKGVYINNGKKIVIK